MLRQTIRHLSRTQSALRCLSHAIRRLEGSLGGVLEECRKRSRRVKCDAYGSGCNQFVEGRVARAVDRQLVMEAKL
jgi:hypothetical protein